MTSAGRVVSCALAVVGLAGWVTAQTVEPGSTFRVFLKGGDPLPSYGEAAIVGDRVIFTLLVGGETDIRRRYQLVDLPTDEVDLDRTVAYANALRGAHYAATRGEAEYAEMAAAISRALDTLPSIADPVERLQAGELAHERMREWSRRSYGYRAEDVEALEDLFGVVLAELRSDAGMTQLSIELSSGSDLRSAEPLRAPPDTGESIRLALAAASAADTGSERLAILGAAESVLVESALEPGLLLEVRERLEAERAAEAGYAALSRELTEAADQGLRRGDPQAVARLMRVLEARDRELGQVRRRLVRALRRQLDVKLEATEAYRAALDHYAKVRPVLLGYERRVRPALSTLDGLRPILEALRELRFTSYDRLATAGARLDEAQLTLESVDPPGDVLDVHATFVSAVHLAREAVARRREAAATASAATDRNAASAAAGALMLVGQARSDLVARLFPPKPE